MPAEMYDLTNLIHPLLHAFSCDGVDDDDGNGDGDGDRCCRVAVLVVRKSVPGLAALGSHLPLTNEVNRVG